jgi:hypothetical protein
MMWPAAAGGWTQSPRIWCDLGKSRESPPGPYLGIAPVLTKTSSNCAAQSSQLARFLEQLTSVGFGADTPGSRSLLKWIGKECRDGASAGPPKTESDMAPSNVDLLLKEFSRACPPCADGRRANRWENPATSASVTAA